MLSRHRSAPGDAAVGPAHPSLGAGRRTLVLLALVAVVGAPAVILRAFCVGHSCDEPANASSEVPFCSLPEDTRSRIAAGFREGRSPEVLAVAADRGLVAETGPAAAPWPSAASDEETRVPIAFWGAGIESGAQIAPGTGLDDVAPTIADVIGFDDRPFPNVRSGRAIEGVASGEVPRLVVQIVWVGRGSGDLREGRAPTLEAALSSGASTLDGDTVSVPVDPPAVLTTIGTGGRPSQHGMTGALVRDDAGKLRKVWGPKTPPLVIATLGDDLDEELRQDPEIGIAAARRAYRGAIGGDWYVDVDRDRIVRASRGREPEAVARLLRPPFGADDVPDLAVVVVESGIRGLEETLRAAVRRAEKLADGSAAFVFTATGATPPGTPFEVEAMQGEDVAALVEAVAPGGLFLDQKELARRGATEDEVLAALRGMQAPYEEGRLFADVFPAIAVAFGRYC